jgi:hypothetical protein
MDQFAVEKSPSLKPRAVLRTPSPVRTKIWGAETHDARTGPFPETEAHIHILTGRRWRPELQW